MADQLDLLKLVASRLDGAGIPYMLTGSIAVSHYAEPRFTRDVDLVVQLAASGAEAATALFAHDFYADADALRSAVLRRGMANLIHLETLIKVDLIIRKATPYHIEAFGRRRQVVIDGARIWIVSPEDLVLSKLEWLKQGGSDVHRRDVRNLLGCLPDLDRPCIALRARELTVSDLWREVLATWPTS